MVKVKSCVQNDTYHKGNGLTNKEELDHSQIYHVKTFKSHLIASIYIFYCKLVYDYIEIEYN